MEVGNCIKKTVVITGASGGIGSAISRKFAKMGYNIVLGYNKNKKRAESLAAELSTLTQVIAIKVDISKKVEIEAFFEKAERVFGKIDVLVNNAGISKQKLLIDTTYEDMLEVMNTNLVGAIYATKLAVQNMLKFKAGHVINISSIFAIRGGSFETIYSASKSGFTAFTSALAREVGPSGIYVNTVAPGAIDTEMNAGFDKKSQELFFDNSATKRMGTPEEVAETVYFLASESSSYINGQTLIVDGGTL